MFDQPIANYIGCVYLQRPGVCLARSIIVGAFTRPNRGKTTLDLVVGNSKLVTDAVADLYCVVHFAGTAMLEVTSLRQN